MAPEQDKPSLNETISLLRGAKFARLATLDAGNGQPFVSLLAVALSSDGRPLTMISSLARHTANLEVNAVASLLYEEPVPGDERLLARPRVTISGKMAKYDDGAARDLFLNLHKDAHVYAGFSDFALWQMEIDEAYLVAGFGRIHTIPGADLKT